jgi:hypothetical protein
MKSGEKPLEHTHFIPALCFGCLSEMQLASKYITSTCCQSIDDHRDDTDGAPCGLVACSAIGVPS